MFDPAAECLGSVLLKHMQLSGDNIAQIDSVTGQRDSFKSLLQRCVRTSLKLLSRGINEEDIISLCTDNHLDSAVPFISSQFIGCKVAPLDPKLSIMTSAILLEQIKPKMIFVDSQSLDKIVKAINQLSLSTEIIVFGRSDQYVEFGEFLNPQKGEEYFKPTSTPSPRDTAIIYFSSGTSGMPKGICLSHYSILRQVQNAFYVPDRDEELLKRESTRLNFPLTFVCFSSLYWVSAGNTLIACTIAGVCRLLCSNFHPKDVWDLIGRYRPLYLSLLPSQAIEMCRYGKPDEVNVGCLLRLNLFGAPVSMEHVSKIRKILPETDVYKSYGLTEAGGMITTFQPLSKRHRVLMKKKPESCGLLAPGISYKIVNPETEEELHGPYQTGELRIKADFLMNGYYNSDSSAALDENGWLKTGDIVYHDEDFCFYVIDRIKNLLKVRNLSVSPAILEAELLKHPSVKQAVVIGIPHDIQGDLAMALVVINDHVEGIREEDIETFMEGRISECEKLEAGVRFIKSVPLTPTGKIRRTVLRDLILNRKTC